MFSPRRAFCLLMFLYLVPSECKGDGYKPAPNCTSVECPPYNVVHSEKEFEIRSYKDALWVSSPKISETSYLGGVARGSRILDEYYNGNNVQHVKIDITAPFLLDVQPALIYVQNSTYTTYYYVPQKYQKGIPTPLLPEIKPVKLPKHKYAAVRRFNSFLSDDNIAIQLAALKKSLKGTPYQRAATLDLFTIVSYNIPDEVTDLVNEVFLSFD
ncbi:hypothetical protein Pfo_016168 [Paulownia fortunei]|nr:hypothetical protein Pfo_016168 [Paulownia fortunei]